MTLLVRHGHWYSDNLASRNPRLDCVKEEVLQPSCLLVGVDLLRKDGSCTSLAILIDAENEIPATCIGEGRDI